MSDSDFMQDSEPEDYDFDLDDGDEEPRDAAVENKYYYAKQLKLDHPDEAISEFLGVAAMEEEKGDWGFKGYKQAIKAELDLGKYEDAVAHFKELLTYAKSAVTRSYAEKSISNLLDYSEKRANRISANDASAIADDANAGATAAAAAAAKCMEEFYALTIASFAESHSNRLWLKINIKLAHLWLERGDFVSLEPKLEELHKACRHPDGTDDPIKGTYSLEIYAMEIQMHAHKKNNARLKALYKQALSLQSAVPHPRIMAVIRECAGKMNLSEERWAEAQSDFYEAFRNYDEAGSAQRVVVLKYFVLTTMLVKSDINPFDSQETKSYMNDPRISGIREVVEAYQQDDLLAFNAALRKNADLLNDSYISDNIGEVVRALRRKAMIKLITPYDRFTLSFIARRLKICVPETVDIITSLMIDGSLPDARIDGQTGVVQVLRVDPGHNTRVDAIEHWSDDSAELSANMYNGAEGFREEDDLSSALIGPESNPYASSSRHGQNQPSPFFLNQGDRPRQGERERRSEKRKGKGKGHWRNRLNRLTPVFGREKDADDEDDDEPMEEN